MPPTATMRSARGVIHATSSVDHAGTERVGCGMVPRRTGRGDQLWGAIALRWRPTKTPIRVVCAPSVAYELIPDEGCDRETPLVSRTETDSHRGRPRCADRL